MNSDLTQKKTYQWKEPASCSLQRSTLQMKGWVGKLFRTGVITLGIELLFYYLLYPLPLKDVGVDLNHVFYSVFLVAVVMSICCYIGPYFERFNRVNYTVNDKGIRIKNRFYLWKRIIRCEHPQNNEECGGVINLCFFHTRGAYNKSTLVFDESQRELAAEIYHYIQEKIPILQKSVHERLRLCLEGKQKFFLLSLSVSISLLLAIVVSLHLSIIAGSNNLILFCYLVLLFGPGTLGMLILYRNKLFQYSDWPIWVIAYNYFGFIIMMLFVVVFATYELAEIFRRIDNFGW